MNVEDLIVGPHVWRGRAGRSSHAVLATGFDALDRQLGGGWPWGAISEIFVERYGIGELSVLMPALASLQGWIVWVAPPMIPYAPALARWGVDLDRILLVDSSGEPGSAGENAEALWATEQAVRSGACAAVLGWLGSASDPDLRRLQLAAEERRCGLMLFRPLTALRQRSPAALRMRLSCAGAAARVEILKCRGARPSHLNLDLSRYRRSGEAECR